MSRRLTIETLEHRALLSAAPTSSTQSLSALPLAEQQSISSAIGADQPAYHATSGASGVSFSNSANAFTAQLQSGALQIATGADSWGMALAGLSFGGASQNLGTAETSISGNRADIIYGGVDEWYVNGPSGLEQGFTLAALPQSEATGTLTVELALTGNLVATVNASGTSLALTSPDGSTELLYTGLSAVDATGKSLPATLQVETVNGKEELLIHVNDTGAKGQITIDPFVQAAELTAPASQRGSNFGWSVANEGSTVVVGEPWATVNSNEFQGAAYVFADSDSGMTRIAELTASDGAEGDNFGQSVAIDGNTIVVGADQNTAQHDGAAYVFTEPVSGWSNMTQTAKLTASDGNTLASFGDSVAVSGSTVVVGAQGTDANLGSAYVFRMPAGGWVNATQTAELSQSADAFELFGSSVSISGDTVVVGAVGAAFLYAMPSGGWADMAETADLTASDAGSLTGFGLSVSVSGENVVVGALAGEAGEAYVYTEPDAGWSSMTQTAILTASDNTESMGNGWTVAISGDTVVAGAQYATIDGKAGQGAVFVFTESGSGWADMSSTDELIAADGGAYDDFGRSVSISEGTIVVGSPSIGSGAAYVFTQATAGWTNTTELGKLTSADAAANDQLGLSVAVSGNTVVVGAPDTTVGYNADEGTAYIFTKPADGWANMTQVAMLTATNGTANEYFGDSVAIDGDTVVIGSTAGAYVFTMPAGGWSNMTETAKLTTTDDSVGTTSSVAISGNTIVFGSPDATVAGKVQEGAAYVFTEPAGGWSDMAETAELTASDGVALGNFGESVAVSGRTIVVGSPFNQGGTAYVFTMPEGGWTDMTQTAELTETAATGSSSFGISVAINGSTVVVGASGQTVGSNQSQGAAYVFAEPESGWANMTQTATLTASGGGANDRFGDSVAISGGDIVVGAPFATANSVMDSGAAYIFSEPESGWTDMTQTAEITASDGASGDAFGNSVAIDGSTVVVGANLAMVGLNSDQGEAYVFTLSGSSASQSAELTASNDAANEEFGYSVSISGNTVVVGAPDATVGGNAAQGAAYVFALAGDGSDNMVQVANLTAADGAAGDEFGSSVSISGDTVVVGSPDADESQGTAYVFTEPSSGWANMTQTAELTASDGAADDLFGGSASIDGSTVVVGATGADSQLGAAYVFTEPGSGWANATQTAELNASDAAAGDLFGGAVAVSGDTVAVGASGANLSQGTAYIFTEPGSGWVNATQTAELTASDGAARDEFGYSIAIDNGTVAVGAPFNASAEGAAYVFVEPGAGWSDTTQTAKLTASDGQSDDELGVSVSISNGSVVAGMGYGSSQSGYSPKAAYIFTEPSSGWADMTQTAKLIASDGAASNDFGTSVSLSGNTAVVGAYNATVGANDNQGSAYIFDPVPSITGVSSPDSGGYAQGSTVSITVTFDEPVTVTGVPDMLLNAGDGAAALYSGGSGTATLTFTYTVGAGQSATDLDYLSTSALQLEGGTIENAKGEAAILTLPATGTDGLATQDITILPSFDGFETGDFSALPWQLSNVGTASNWSVQSTNVHDGTYAAQSGPIGANSNSVLSLTMDVQAGELSFWRSTTSATGTGSLIFEIDGVPQLQLSGTMPWQQSFFYVSSGQHTFTWMYAKGASDHSGADYADLDDVQFTPGTTLTVNGTAGNDAFSFSAAGAAIVMALNGEIHSFPAGEFTNFVFVGGGGSDAAYLAGAAAGVNYASFDADGSGQLTNSTAGFTVSVSGMTSMHADGDSADVAQFFDSPGNDTFYAYADYNGSGQQLAGMYGSYGAGYSNSATGFGTNIAYSSAGGSDFAAFFDSPGNDSFYSYADYNNGGQQLAGMYGSYGGGYSNTAKGFATNVGISTEGGSDVAVFHGSTGNDTYYGYADYNNSGTTVAGMYGSYGGGYSNSASGFSANVAYAGSGSNELAVLFDAPGTNTFNAYADYNNSGQSFASMTSSYGGGSTDSVNGFNSVLGMATLGSGDTANLYDSASANYLYTDAAIALLYGNSFGAKASGFSVVNANGQTGVTNNRVTGSDALTYQLNLLGAWTTD